MRIPGADVDWAGRRIVIQRSLKLRMDGTWRFTPPKTEKNIRSIALADAFVKGLEDHRRRQLEMRLKAGAGWTDAGLPETFKLKVSRHSCASALLNDGVPLKMVSDTLGALGHSSVAITADVYGVTDEDRRREVSERIERLFGIGEK